MEIEKPTTDGDEAWKEYWAKVQPKEWFETWGYWRTEPEISEERQAFLAERLVIQPDIGKGIYPFKDISLNRADIEWLLATHENGKGPVNWADSEQRTRQGVDLRGAVISELEDDYIDLDDLPLTRTLFGLTSEDVKWKSDKTIRLAGAYLKHVSLGQETHFEGVSFNGSYLERAFGNEAAFIECEFQYAFLDKATLINVRFEKCDLSMSSCKATNFTSGTFVDVSFYRANLQKARFRTSIHKNVDFSKTNLKEASLTGIDGDSVNFREANMFHVDLTNAKVVKGDFSNAVMKKAWIYSDVYFEDSYFRDTDLTNSTISGVYFGGSLFNNAVLKRSEISDSIFSGALLTSCHFEKANLRNVQFGSVQVSEKNLKRANLYRRGPTISEEKYMKGRIIPLTLFHGKQPPADLQESFFSAETTFDNVTFGDRHASAKLADVRWGGVNFAVIDWRKTPILGHELDARKKVGGSDKAKVKEEAKLHYVAAIREYRQVASEMRAQGMNNNADQFAYRAQVCERIDQWNKKNYGFVLWSGFLDILAGYGYRPVRTLIAYLIIILGFAVGYDLLFAPLSHVTLSPLGSLVFSISSFHGRGFFPGPTIPLDVPLTVAAASEAIVGLLIEVSFIATFTQRFFGK